MKKTELSKADQKKVSSACQGCGMCCKGGPMSWFYNYTNIEDIRLWSKNNDTWARIRALLQDSHDKGLINDKRRTMRNIAYNLSFKSEFKSPDMDCGCLERTGVGKKATFCCAIERRLGWKYKPKTCREYVCDKVNKALKPKKAVKK